MDHFYDTVAAVATPDGEGGIGIIRISGEDAAAVADRVFLAQNRRPLAGEKGYSMRLGRAIVDGSAIDDVIALLFRAPKSYTGEDVVEIQCHGGPVLLRRLLRGVIDAGARPAEAGEFTRRAFLNGRMSLTEAEGIAGMISAASKQGEEAAYALSGGLLFRETERLKREILELQSGIAAYIDFPEEDVEPVDAPSLIRRIGALALSLRALTDSYETGSLILRGVPAMIAGSPNVGKSTLMNLIAGYEKAIVSPAAGTTRDVVEHRVQLGGTTLLLADTAGIRESDDTVEQIGISRAVGRIGQSALILAVFDGSRPLSLEDRAIIRLLRGRTVTAVVSKADLGMRTEIEEIRSVFGEVVQVNAKDPASLRLIDEAVRRTLRLEHLSADMPLLMNERQRAAAKGALSAAEDALSAAGTTTLDVVYALLDEALSAVMSLSGENVSDAVIDEVFRRFCVGK